VTVGETLTEARYQAGLSVEELSERTRIRGTVIRSIEEDDYGPCGGDLYVRGYVRAIAGAVGIDAQPLIRAYDLGRANGSNARANGSADGPADALPSVPPPGAAPTAFDLPAVTEAPAGNGGPADLDATRFDLPAVSADPAATSYDLPAVPEFPAATAEFPVATAEFPAALPFAMIPPDVAPAAAAQPPRATETRLDLAAVPEDLMDAGYDLRPAAPAEADSATKILPALGTDQAGPREPAGQPVPVPAGSAQPSFTPAGNAQASFVLAGNAQAGRARRKRRGLFALAAVVVLAAAGGLGVYLGTGSTATANTAATTVPSPAASAAAQASAARASASAAAKSSAAAQASTSAAAKASQEAAAKAGAARVVSLPVVSAVAFGPDGFADGDNPGNAKYAIARNAAQPWQTQWYVTPDFGMLKHGTGLLLDLGGKVTVTSVRLDLGQYRSTDLQIRVGNGTASQDLKVAATASNVGGAVKLTLRHPAAARYVLLWFTQLPPDGAGHYQESVSHVVVSGRR
jgi:cytoskeletal protein RodZ